MPKWDPATLSEPQRRWFAAIRDGLERDTGRDLQAWADLARACPETGHRGRLAWIKQVHGLGQNRASIVLAEAFPNAEPSADAQDDPLWDDPAARAVCEAVAAVATSLDGVVTGRRKGFTAFSRRYQFAAVRPLRRGGVRLGLAVGPDGGANLSAPTAEPWSERLTAIMTLDGPPARDGDVAGLIRIAWERS